MNKKQTSNRHLSKYVFILSIAIICSLIFSVSNAREVIKPSILANSKALLNKAEENAIVKQDTLPAASDDVVLNETAVIRMSADKTPANIGIPEDILIFVDGVKINREDMNSLNKISPDDIASMTVYKAETAIEKFGKDAKGGVIDITTKSNKKQ